MKYRVNVPKPHLCANKYSRGKLVLVAGSARYPGAAVLAARASQRMGTGYTEVITHKQALNVVRSASPSLVVRPFSDWDLQELYPTSLKKPIALCVGPGFVGEGKRERELLAQVLKKAQCPVLVDGGALIQLCSEPMFTYLMKRADKGLDTIVTPHEGEAQRLAASLCLNFSSSDKLSAALALELRSLVVLKGPNTYISEGKAHECVTEGTPALAKAGTGDVLAGMISSLLAQGVPPMDAAISAVVLHARAGVAAARRLNDICVTAEDVIESIPEVMV